jgi:hypothetical protein
MQAILPKQFMEIQVRNMRAPVVQLLPPILQWKWPAAEEDAAKDKVKDKDASNAVEDKDAVKDNAVENEWEIVINTI